MQEKTAEATESEPRATQHTGKNNDRRNSRKLLSRTGRERKQANADVHLFATDCITPISSIQIDYQKEEGIFEHIPQQDLIKLIQDLYPIVQRKLPHVFELADLKEDMTEFQFLEWLLSLYSGTIEYEFDLWSIGFSNKLKKYEFLKVYDYDDIGTSGRSAPIFFLFNLKDNSKEIYDLFLDYIHLLYKNLNIPMWFNSTTYDYAEEMLPEEIDARFEPDTEDEDEKEWIADAHFTLDMYKGFGVELMQKIVNSKTTKNKYLKALKAFKPKDEAEKLIVEFLKENKNLLSIKDSISNYYIPGYSDDRNDQDGPPITIDQYAAIMFSWEPWDKIFEITESESNIYYNEYGIVPFRQVISDNEVEQEIVSDTPHKYVKMLDALCELNRNLAEL